MNRRVPVRLSNCAFWTFSLGILGCIVFCLRWLSFLIRLIIAQTLGYTNSLTSKTIIEREYPLKLLQFMIMLEVASFPIMVQLVKFAFDNVLNPWSQRDYFGFPFVQVIFTIISDTRPCSCIVFKSSPIPKSSELRCERKSLSFYEQTNFLW